MKNVKLLLILFISLVFAGATMAQGTVKGVIRDASSHETLVGASIVVAGTQTGVTTDLDGAFSLKVPTGKQTLKISFVGYQPKEINVSLSQGETKNLGKIDLKSATVGLQEVNVLASIAVNRKTPVAISTIRPQVIAQQLGNQEFPEIMKYTPSVYTTKEGGGYGDARINIRGFSSNNVGVLINGIPVNDMENGHVYWSDWAGLSDVTQTIQVQRGLGYSKVALSSVGGTINIVTKSTDAERGGSIYSGLGNDGMHKYRFTLSTGLMKNGWAITISGAHTFGNGYIDATNFDGFSYFLNVSKQFTPNHRISFTLFGAPQWHNQRGNKHKIATYLGVNPNIPYAVTDKYRYNSDYGYMNGKIYGGAYGYNYYDKPQASLNDYWKINDKSFLTTALYASIAKGGGRRVSGYYLNSNASHMLMWNYIPDQPYAETKLTPQGTYDYAAVEAINKASLNGSEAIIGESVNSHEWYGILSSLNTSVGNMNYTFGIDGRYYVGNHAMQIENLLGGTYFLDNGDINRPATTPLHTGDYYSYHDDGIIRWLGLYAQGEYVKDNFSAFLSLSGSNKSYNRKEYFLETPGNQMAGWHNFWPWSAKGGVNYNVTKRSNFYLNAGYFTRAPYFNNVFVFYTNYANPQAKYEKVMSGEVGYGFKSSLLQVKLGLYWTKWMDQGFRKTSGSYFYTISGVDELHKGVELTTTYRPVSKLTLRGMLSVGDWRYTANALARKFDQNNNLIPNSNAYLNIKNVHVGNAAQTTAGLRARVEIVHGMHFGVGYTYFGNNFSDFDPTNRLTPNQSAGNGPDSWKMPDYGLVDLDINYDFKLGPFNATLYGNVQNLLNTVYIADATDEGTHLATDALVWYGFGRTWYMGLKIKF
jgi:iron complex outermembrane recepter protein